MTAFISGNAVLDTPEDEAELLLDIDFHGEENCIDLPSPDGTRQVTTINDIWALVSHHCEEHIMTMNEQGLDLSMAEEVILTDSDSLNPHPEGPRDLSQSQPLLIVSDTDGHQSDGDTSDSDSEIKESESKAEFGSLIPTTVEAASKWDKSPRKEKVHLNTPKPKSIKSRRSIVHPQRKLSKPKQQKKRDVERKRNLLLWQFLLSVLHNSSHNPSIIMWLNFKEGVFKIVHSQSLAQLWGACRNKKTGIKYEFFARAMRHYYRQGIIKRIPGKKLVYQFGEKIDWKKNRYTKPTHHTTQTQG